MTALTGTERINNSRIGQFLSQWGRYHLRHDELGNKLWLLRGCHTGDNFSHLGQAAANAGLGVAVGG